MEHILGVEEDWSTSVARRAAQELGEDAVEADQISEATKDVARARYQRLFWEPVVDGKVRACVNYSVHACQRTFPDACDVHLP